MIEIHTSNAPLDYAGRQFTKILKQQKGNDLLLLFSGGSSLAIIERLHPKYVSDKCSLTVFDERYGSYEKSNFSKLDKTTFFRSAIKNGVKTIDPRPFEGETLERAGKRFDLAIKEWHIKHRDGIVIITAGIGADGHIAGVLPLKNKALFEKTFLHENTCAVGYNVPPEVNPHSKRITTTLTYIRRHVDYAIVYATGVQKREALKRTVSEKINLLETPAQILQQVHNVHLFTDLSLH